MEGYGVPTSEEGLLPWSHVSERMDRARNYWVGTTRPSVRPHAAPVWGAWVEGTLYFETGPRSRKGRNLATNPAVAVHLESGDDVVILEGVAETVTNPDPALFARVADAFAAKYDGYRPEPGGEGLYAVRPCVVYAWSKFPADVTRWLLGHD
jgi:nitroimidazol reductase NimA-like FMN-containing flavoprotein (pyridoxamine 5'-phosphate oxidase superfamily)